MPKSIVEEYVELYHYTGASGLDGIVTMQHRLKFHTCLPISRYSPTFV